MSSEDENTRDRARRLRAESTDGERKLWNRLRAKRLAGFAFRRQHPIGPYFADFCCVAQRLIVELDGSQHADEEKALTDKSRTAYLEAKGYRVLRFWNSQIHSEIENVLETIYSALTSS
jgi:very-short-patch-repair endonuclease